MEVALDAQWLSLGHMFYWVRVLADVRFQATAGGFMDAQSAILDTGCPITVVPRSIWEYARVHRMGQRRTMGGPLSQDAVGELGIVWVTITDPENASPRVPLRALLLDDDSLPLILGFGDLLTRARFSCDFDGGEASLEFPLHEP